MKRFQVKEYLRDLDSASYCGSGSGTLGQHRQERVSVCNRNGSGYCSYTDGSELSNTTSKIDYDDMEVEYPSCNLSGDSEQMCMTGYQSQST